jgi:hypothetical protein
MAAASGAGSGNFGLLFVPKWLAGRRQSRRQCRKSKCGKVMRKPDRTRRRSPAIPVSTFPKNGLRTHSGPVAQWSELAAHNRLVAGSSPAGPTNEINYLAIQPSNHFRIRPTLQLSLQLLQGRQSSLGTLHLSLGLAHVVVQHMCVVAHGRVAAGRDQAPSGPRRGHGSFATGENEGPAQVVPPDLSHGGDNQRPPWPGRAAIGSSVHGA